MRETPVFDSLQLLISHLLTEVLRYEDDKLIKMSFDGQSVLMFVTGSEIPINISKHIVYSPDLQSSEETILANVYAELLQMDLGHGWLSMLDEICRLIDANSHLFDGLLKGVK